MNEPLPRTARSGRVCAALLVLVLVLAAGCATPRQTNLLAAGGAIHALGQTPTTNIVQTYYLGVFDPREQLPTALYRVRIQGQASALSWSKFASGWVRADLVDSLSGRIDVERSGVRVDDAAGGGVRLADDKSGLNRRLVMFGPEGFREAPKNHRLVVVMGSNPEGFFQATDRALGVVAAVTQPGRAGPEALRPLSADMARLREERRAMQTLLDLAGEE